jgi:hypothetical protein
VADNWSTYLSPFTLSMSRNSGVNAYSEEELSSNLPIIHLQGLQGYIDQIPHSVEIGVMGVKHKDKFISWSRILRRLKKLKIYKK